MMKNEIIKYCLSQYPNEACGFVINGRVVPMINEADDPANEFLINHFPDGVERVFHSHFNGDAYPSEADLRQQIVSDVPWIIVTENDYFEFGDGVPPVPLIGRGFRFGVHFCYSLVKDFYSMIYGIEIPPVAIEWEFWKKKENNIFENVLSETDFKPVSLNHILPGDAFFCNIRSEQPNHIAVYIGDGLMLHHMTGRNPVDLSSLSTIDSYERWQPFVTKVVRHDKTNHVDRKTGKEIWSRIQPGY